MAQTLLRSLLILILVCAVHQARSADLSGRVTDRVTHAALPGVHVSVVNQGAVAETNDEGEFRFTGLAPGRCTIRVSMVGYVTNEKNVVVAEGVPADIRIELEPSAVPFPPVVITATRTHTSRVDVPSSVDVIPAPDIVRSRDLAQALIRVPGVVIKDYGSLGDIKTVSIRGSSAGQVLVLLDGQRMNNVQSGEVNLSTVPLDAVERIEVVRGGASALYGADAVGGVVNIITTRDAGRDLRVDGTVQAGSFGTWGGSLAGQGGDETLSGHLAFRYLTSKGNFPYRDPSGIERLRMNADAVTRSASGGFRWTPAGETPHGVATATFRYAHSSAGSPGTIDQLNALARKKSDDLFGRLSYERHMSALAPVVRAELFAQRMDFTFDDAASYIPVHASTRNGAWGAEIQGRVVPDRLQTITVGTALRQDHLTGDGLGATHARRLFSAYAQDEILVPLGPDDRWRFTIVPAVRWDEFSDFGTVVSPRAGTVFRMDQHAWLLSLRAHYGESFRAPTFNDLYWPRDNFAVGNASLAPERARDMEAGVHALLPLLLGLEADVALFWNRVSDMIVWQVGAGGIWSPTNVGKADLKGVETRVAVDPWEHHLRLAWDYALLEAVNRTDNPLEYGRQLPYRPRHMHHVTLEMTQGRMSGSLQVAYTGRRFVTTSSSVALPAYRTMDAAFNYTWADHPVALQTTLEVRNLTDARYQTIDGFPMPGREFRLFISLRLRGSDQ